MESILDARTIIHVEFAWSFPYLETECTLERSPFRNSGYADPTLVIAVMQTLLSVMEIPQFNSNSELYTI